MSFDQAEAAHILPYCLLKLKTTDTLRINILHAAAFGQADIDAPRNALFLCPSHHATFDAYHWTFDPVSGKILVQAGADNDPALVDSVLDVSHRPVALQPTTAVWTAYNEYVFSDKGAGVSAALKAQRRKKGPAAVDRAGGGADAE